jgi:hypothetical protein
LQAKNLVRAKARRSFAAQEPHRSARSAPLLARAISDLASPPPPAIDRSLSLEGLEALENLFLDSPSKIVDIDAVDPRSSSSPPPPLVIFDPQDDDPKNVTMSIDREGPSHRRRHRRRKIELESGASTGSRGAAAIGSEDADDSGTVGSMENASSSAALRLATSGAKRKKKKKKKQNLEEEEEAPTAGSLVRKRVKTLTKIRSKIELESRVQKKNKKLEPNNRGIRSVVDVRDLVFEYGGSVNLMAHDWSKLDRELLSVDEERCLASLMKPFKVYYYCTHPIVVFFFSQGPISISRDVNLYIASIDAHWDFFGRCFASEVEEVERGSERAVGCGAF